MNIMLPKGFSGICRPKKYKLKFTISYGIMGYCKLIKKIPKKYLASHSFELWNNNEIHEANLKGVQKRNIEKYMNPEWEFWLFRNNQMGASQYASGIAYSQARVGMPYDIPAFLKFLVKFIPQIKWAYHCSEFQAFVIRIGKMLKWVPLITKPHKVTPSDAFVYAMSEQGKKDDWELRLYWNGKELLNKY